MSYLGVDDVEEGQDVGARDGTCITDVRNINQYRTQLQVCVIKLELMK